MTEPNAPVECAAAMRKLFDFLDGELDEEAMAAVRSHLAVCAKCYPHYDFERTFLEAVAATRAERPAPSALRGRVLARLREAGYRGRV
jgi:anti-sigma factor (TIGR02949 family)